MHTLRSHDSQVSFSLAIPDVSYSVVEKVEMNSRLRTTTVEWKGVAHMQSRWLDQPLWALAWAQPAWPSSWYVTWGSHQEGHAESKIYFNSSRQVSRQMGWLRPREFAKRKGKPVTVIPISDVPDTCFDINVKAGVRDI